jgi:hypothetical protein
MSAPAARTGGLQQWAGLAGIAYVALFIGGSILAFSGQPDTDSPPAKIIAYYSKGSHRDKISVGWILAGLGLLAFIWFLAALRQYLRDLDGGGFLSTLTLIGGGVYASLSLTGFALNTAIKTMSDDTFRHQVYPDLIHAADDAGYVIHATGGVGAGTMMIAATLAASKAGRLPGWAAWLGVISGILAVGSIFFFPQALIAIWIIVAAVLLFRTQPAREPAAPTPAAA